MHLRTLFGQKPHPEQPLSRRGDGLWNCLDFRLSRGVNLSGRSSLLGDFLFPDIPLTNSNSSAEFPPPLQLLLVSIVTHIDKSGPIRLVLIDEIDLASPLNSDLIGPKPAFGDDGWIPHNLLSCDRVDEWRHSPDEQCSYPGKIQKVRTPKTLRIMILEVGQHLHGLVQYWQRT